MTKEAMTLALEDYLSREMPAGTVIGDPKWWAAKIANALAKQEQREPVAIVAWQVGGNTVRILGEVKPGDLLYTRPQPKEEQDSEFKNFHRQLCERFNCVHDEKDWKRDQVSLIDWIAKEAQPKREPLTEVQFDAIRDAAFRRTGWDSGNKWDKALKDGVEAAHGIKE